MKLPLLWLKEYIPVALSAEKLSDALTMSGSKVEAVENKDGESVIEIEVTTNRPDTLSILGLAREVASLTSKKVNFPKIISKKSVPAKSFSIEIEDKKGCPFYTGRLIRNVAIKASPIKNQKLLSLVDVRAINNVVDVTNFVLFEMGQPLHAFDFDKVEGGKIIVRRAKSGEKFLAIDGNEYTLDEKTLVIADASRAIAIAGVMGGKLTEVTSSTKNVLLESAYFDPALVRQASRKYKLSTDSSYRFERQVNIDTVRTASARARDLILEWAGGEETEAGEKNFAKKELSKKITLDAARVEAILGLKVAPARCAKILNDLGFSAKAKGSKLFVTVPSFRKDVTMEADLIEEIIRIEGLDKVPTTIPATQHTLNNIEDRSAVKTMGIKKFTSALGFQEVITYSLISKKLLNQSGFEENQAAHIKNFVSAEQEFIRPSLLPGMLSVAMFNLHRKAESLKLFEVGHVVKDGQEENVLSLLVVGNFQRDWLRKEEATFYHLKGVTENILKHLGAKNIQWQESVALVDGKPVAKIKAVEKKILTAFDILKNVFFAELSLDAIFQVPGQVTKVKAVPKFPSVHRDIAIVVDQAVPVAKIEQLIFRVASPYIRDIKLFDQYIGKGISQGKRSLAFSLAYQKDSATFTDEEINALQNKVGESLKQEFKVEFR